MFANVFAIDPGGTTGWCFVSNADTKTIPSGECDIEIATAQMGGDENRQALDLFKLIKQTEDGEGVTAVIIEDFVPQQLNKERHFLSPVRISSKLELLLWQDDHRWFKQMPSLVMATISDEYLKSIDLYNPGKPHANDATRHALVYLRRIAGNEFIHERNIMPIGLSTNGDY